ncbi:MAG: LysR family transcriptional regulator [Oscillospiraceae bacterium]|nr:LysR family transcriptional regulator [Oscillospiraceae bacterium]
MQIETVQAFLQVCRDGAISRSCEKMNISQQGLSRQLQAMEKELGVKLLERSRQGIRPTRDGMMLRPYFEEIERQYAAALRMVRRRGDPDVIRMGFSVSAAHAVGSNFVIQYQTLHPDMLVQISSVTNDDCENQLLSGELDAALLVSPRNREKLDCTLIFESPSCAVVSRSHPLAEKEKIRLQDLEGETVFVPNRQYRMRQLFDEVHRDMIPRFGRVLSSAEYMDYLKLPAQNSGVALGFDVFCQNLDENLVVIPTEEKFPIRIYFCIDPRGTHSPRLEDFRGYVKEMLRMERG